LPKRELTLFDGSDITKYRSFITSFERIVEGTSEDDGDRLHYLQQSTGGRAKKLVDSCSHQNPSAAFASARQLLEEEFGNEFKVSNAYLDKLRKWPAIRSEDAKAFEDFSLFLTDCHNYLQNMSTRNQLQSPNEMTKIIGKLPFQYQARWRRVSYYFTKSNGTVVFKDLVDFIAEESSVLNQPVFGTLGDSNTQVNRAEKLKKVLTTQSTNDPNQEKSPYGKLCQYCSKTDHYISSCKPFENMCARDKSQYIMKVKLCFGCLRAGHMSKNCPKRSKCGLCKRNHPTVLHDPARIKNPMDDSEPLKTKALSIKGAGPKIIAPTLPVKISLNGREVTTNCVLDSCASDCWMDEKLLDALGIKPVKKSITITTMESKHSTCVTKVVNNLKVCDLNDGAQVIIPVVYTKQHKTWPFSKDDLPNPADIEVLSHLSEVPFTYLDADIGLLIGMNIPEVLKPAEVIGGEAGQPYASKHTFGWALNGPVKRLGNKIVCNRVSVSNCVELDKKN
jgi:hypothetical protein